MQAVKIQLYQFTRINSPMGPETMWHLARIVDVNCCHNQLYQIFSNSDLGSLTSTGLRSCYTDSFLSQCYLRHLLACTSSKTCKRKGDKKTQQCVCKLWGATILLGKKYANIIKHQPFLQIFQEQKQTIFHERLRILWLFKKMQIEFHSTSLSTNTSTHED